MRRYLVILRGSHVWLLAPTWIAINAKMHLSRICASAPRAVSVAANNAFNVINGRYLIRSLWVVLSTGLFSP